MAVKPVDTLSKPYDLDALLESGPAAPDADIEVEATEQSDDAEVDDSEVEADDDAEDETTDVDSDDDDADTVDSWEIKANGKTHKIDRKNEAEVKRLLSHGLGARQVFSDVAKLRQENKRLVAEMKDASTTKEKAALFDKLESVKDDENELFRLMTGGKSLDDVVTARMKVQEEWATLDPVERKEREAQAREQALESRIQRMELTAKNEREQAEKLNMEAADKRTYSQVHPEFQKVFKALDIKDPVEAQETAADLWELGWVQVERLSAKHKEETGKELDITPELAAKAFARVAKRWGYSVDKATKKEVAKVLDKKSKAATTRAGVAASRNFTKPTSNKLDGLSPTKRFAKLFG